MNKKDIIAILTFIATIIIVIFVFSSPSSEGSLRESSLQAAFSSTNNNTLVFEDVEPTIIFEDLLDAIEWVESGGDSNAVGDKKFIRYTFEGFKIYEYQAVGAYQIHKIYVDDLNRISKAEHTDKYSSPIIREYYHRQSKPCSRAMVRDYLRYYATEKRLGHVPTLEDMARIHNGGPQGYKKESTKSYWKKVKKRLSEQQ